MLNQYLNRKLLVAIALTTVISAVAAPVFAADQCNWKPKRAVTYILPWGVGGGTDANSRMLSSLLSKELGQPVNVINRTGGNGVTGHTALATAKPDGYTIGAVTVEIDTMHWVGLTKLTYKNITPIALVGITPAGIAVKADSKFKNLKEILNYTKAHPGKLTASGTSQGGIWQLALAGMLNAEGIKPDAIRWIPSKGAGPAMKELMAGGVDLVALGLSEAKNLIQQGALRGIVYMNPKRMAALPDVPTTTEVLPSKWTLAAFLTLSGPGGMTHEIACSYEKAALKAMSTPEWTKFKVSRGAEVVKMGSKKLTPFIAKSDVSLGKTISILGLAK